MRYPPKPLVISWLSLLALLALTLCLAYLPLGALNAPVALAIATLKSLIVAGVFMELRHRSGLTRAFAAAGFVWLLVLLWLAGVDYMTRAQFPPALLH
jgi:cytochrome c oxidase subunit 4